MARTKTGSQKAILELLKAAYPSPLEFRDIANKVDAVYIDYIDLEVRLAKLVEKRKIEVQVYEGGTGIDYYFEKWYRYIKKRGNNNPS